MRKSQIVEEKNIFKGIEQLIIYSIFLEMRLINKIFRQ